MFEHPALPHLYLTLDVEVAPLTKRGEVPFLTVRLVVIQVVDRECIAVLRIMRMMAALALVTASCPESVSELLGPCFGICAYEFAHDKIVQSCRVS
jgi:hypothetical protein